MDCFTRRDNHCRGWCGQFHHNRYLEHTWQQNSYGELHRQYHRLYGGCPDQFFSQRQAASNTGTQRAGLSLHQHLRACIHHRCRDEFIPMVNRSSISRDHNLRIRDQYRQCDLDPTGNPCDYDKLHSQHHRMHCAGAHLAKCIGQHPARTRHRWSRDHLLRHPDNIYNTNRRV